jgi:hypothetical protein
MMSLFVRFEDGMPSEDKAFSVACLSPECHLSWSRTDHRAAASTTVHLHKFLLSHPPHPCKEFLITRRWGASSCVWRLIATLGRAL